MRRLTPRPEDRSVTTTSGTSLRLAGRAVVVVVGPESDVVVAGAGAGVVTGVALRGDTADLEVGDPARACAAGAPVVAVVDVSSVVAVDGLEGAGSVVGDGDGAGAGAGSAGATAARS